MNRELGDNFDRILNAIHEDLLIADGRGTVLKVSATFEDVYSIDKSYAIGKSVYRLEREGYFKPSVVAGVIREKKPITMRQKNNKGRDIIVTATPVFDDDHALLFVVTFSRDITDMLQLREAYSELENKVEKYTEEINELRKSAAMAEVVIGNSEKMAKILQTMKRVSDFDANILFTGPSGVGKTLLAKLVHQNSHRGGGPFLDINCSAIPENLLESELFGYEKGAFTGAGPNGKIGLFEVADGGTLLLDEISEMPLCLQVKLLKAIQDKRIMRVGGTKEIAVNFRLIAATNRNLEEMIVAGRFREDLFYRLNVIGIDIPPLKERSEDVIPLLEHFMRENNARYGLNKRFCPQALEALAGYAWPGNVRELINVVERVSMSGDEDVIRKEALPQRVLRGGEGRGGAKSPAVADLGLALKKLEETIIREAYETHRSSVKVAQALNISQPTAHRKIRQYIQKRI